MQDAGEAPADTNPAPRPRSSDEPAAADARKLLDEAHAAIDRQQVNEAISKLRGYLAHPHAEEKEQANNLLREVELLSSPAEMGRMLKGLTDEQLASIREGGPLPDGFGPSRPPLRQVLVEELRKVARDEMLRRAAIDPRQTSDDETYGFQPILPIQVGGPEGHTGPQSERLFLSHLRDKDLKPVSFQRAGNAGTQPCIRKLPDGKLEGVGLHIIDVYRVTTSSSETVTLYLCMYHPDNHPLSAKAPKGFYIAK